METLEVLRPKLDSVRAEWLGLGEEMANPEIASDYQRYTELAKQRAQIEDVAQAWTEYLKTEEELAGARELHEAEIDHELKAMAWDEIEALETRLAGLLDILQRELMPKDPDNLKNVIVEIRAGTGGEEAALFAADLFRMYSRYAELSKRTVEVDSLSEAEMGGIKEVVFTIKGKGAYGDLRFESGVHRVQRVPETESQGRIHTSAVAVNVLREAQEIDIEIDPKDLRIDTFRAGSAGGQHMQKNETAVRITHIPTNTIVNCQDERSQLQNKERALRILRAMLLEKARQEQEDEASAQRRSQVRSGDRSEKIRTYNFPQSRVTDHRIGYTSHNLQGMLNGEVQELIDALKRADELERVEQLNSEAEGSN